MATKPSKPSKVDSIGGQRKVKIVKEKKTAQGAGKNTRWTSKNDKRNKKAYRGQGR